MRCIRSRDVQEQIKVSEAAPKYYAERQREASSLVVLTEGFKVGDQAQEA